MALQTQASFVLKGVQFIGATGVPDSELQAAVADRIGTSVTFADLEQLAVRAALAVSTWNGGLEQFADLYLRDKDTWTENFRGRTPDLSKLRVA